MQKHRVCEQTKIIVDDGVTIIDGYVECDEALCRVWTTDDPSNVEAKKKPYVLHNRVQYRKVLKEFPAPANAQNKCFISTEAMDEYLTK
ncbi:MAG TPA: hypothetical protein PKJ68_04515 [Candidatus Woesebacteria bacterium]|nr:hypothetical protein [Candidatus Woesebacteria bacterium]